MDENFYNAANKAPEIFRQQVAQISEPQVIENFLSTDEISFLIQTEKEKSESHRVNTPGLWRVNSPWDEAEQFLLRERLQKIIGGFDVWGGNYFISEAPYTAHVDAGKNLGFATYKNVVMPLMIEPPGASTHLILFKQRYFGNSSSFYAAPRKKPIKHGYNEILQDYSRVYDLNEASPIDPEIMNTYLKHIKPADLNGLSVSHILPWKVGTCIIFDASQIHCSAAYTHGGVGKKMGLSLFTRKLPEAGIKPPTM